MRNLKFSMNIVVAFCFSCLLTLSQGRHDRLIWWLALALTVPGVWLARSNPPWWHAGLFFASMVFGRLGSNMWLNVHKLRSGPIMDGIAWIVAAVSINLFLMGATQLRTAVRRSGKISQS